MDREVTVTYSEDLIRFAVWKFWTRYVGLSGFGGFFAVVVGFAYFLLSGDRSWFIGFLGATVCISLGIGIYSYFIYLNRSLDKFRQMEKPTATFHFSDERVSVESNIGRTELSWKMIEKIWKYPKVWLVFIAKQSFATLPTSHLDDDVRKFITQKVLENGGKVE